MSNYLKDSKFTALGLGNHKFKGLGDYIVYCDVSGLPTPFSQTKLQWDGLRVRKEFWTRRQPQDFPAPIRPERAPIDPRPEGNVVTTNQNTRPAKLALEIDSNVNIITEDGRNIITEQEFA